MSIDSQPMFTLDQAAQWLKGSSLLGNGGAQAFRVCTDTRNLQAGDLFVALKGERFDANAFLLDALAHGAAGAICHATPGNAELSESLPLIEVADTRMALIELAKAWRSRFVPKVITVTGSNGKTTVTQMIASILHAFAPNGQALATQGNLNNDIGVPLTVLRLRAQHQIAVIEMGMNHPGEIAELAAIAQPTVALVNNAQREHMEFMHTVLAVAEENGASISALGHLGIAVYPSDDEHASTWKRLAGERESICFSMQGFEGNHELALKHANWHKGAWHVHAHGLGEKLDYRLSVAGMHNVKNSLAAASCALAAGVPAQFVVQGLEAFVPVKGRSHAMELAVQDHLITLVDDSYNANPDSVRAAIDVLAELPGPHMLVLGDMGEVGSQGVHFHAEAGRYAEARGIEHVLTLGELSRAMADVCSSARHFNNIGELNSQIMSLISQVRSVLVKGSRFMRMERVIDAIHAANPQRRGEK